MDSGSTEIKPILKRKETNMDNAYAKGKNYFGATIFSIPQQVLVWLKGLDTI